MSDYRLSGDASQIDRSRLQLRIMTQLLEAAATMYSIDELFQWLTAIILQHFLIQVVEFWTLQTNIAGQSAIQLRTFASQDPSVPRYLVTNNSIGEMAGKLLLERRGFALQPVSGLLSPYNTSLFERYGLHYCTSYFLSSRALLPPLGAPLATTNVLTPLVMTALLFSRQPLPHDIVPTIGLTLDQAVQVAEKRSLLLSTGTSSGQALTPSATSALPAYPATPAPPATRATPTPLGCPRARALPPLTELIPRRRQDSELLVSSNPLATSVDIPDKQARRLYAAIDGRKNVRELCSITRTNIEEISAMLQNLQALRRVDLYHPDGQLVDTPCFLIP